MKVKWETLDGASRISFCFVFLFFYSLKCIDMTSLALSLFPFFFLPVYIAKGRSYRVTRTEAGMPRRAEKTDGESFHL